MAATSQGRIFLSYRRQETAWPARQLYEVLVARFGAESVFKDVDDIEPGDDFVERITEAVGSCTVLLALIGGQWVTMTDAQGRRRLDNPDDFVRLEVEAALARGVRVVPVLVDGAPMPRPDQLPPSMVALTRRQAVEISPTAFNPERLLLTLAGALAPAVQPPPEPAPEQQPPPEPAPEQQPPPEPAPGEQAPPTSTAPESPADVPPVPVTATVAASVASPPTPDLPATLRREHPGPVATEGGPAAQAGPATAPARPPRRWLVPVAAAAAVVLIAAVVLVLRPWAGTAPAASGTPSQAPSTAAPTPSASPTAPPVANGPLVLAHRGGLEQHQFETQAAMESAAAAGFSVETDVRYTADGVAVLVHDEQATKGLDCGGRDLRVSQTTWADLKRYCRSKPTAKDPTRYPVPRLDATLEGIAAASDSAQVFLEVKTDLRDAQRRELVATPAKYGLRDRTVFTSFNAGWLAAVRGVDAGTRRMLFVSGSRVPADTLKDDRLWAVAVEQGIANRAYVDQLKAIGVRVMVWNVNDPAQWATMMSYQPDILMTDYPARFTDWLSKR